MIPTSAPGCRCRHLTSMSWKNGGLKGIRIYQSIDTQKKTYIHFHIHIVYIYIPYHKIGNTRLYIRSFSWKKRGTNFTGFWNPRLKSEDFTAAKRLLYDGFFVHKVRPQNVVQTNYLSRWCMLKGCNFKDKGFLDSKRTIGDARICKA